MTTKMNDHAYTAQLGALGNAERLLEATLAVAYEQRTANLIAFRRMSGEIIQSGSAPTLLMMEQLSSVDVQIVERLGLS